MSDFNTVQFPLDIAYNAVGGPKFKTSVAVMSNGTESRIRWWETERGEWSVSFIGKKPAEWQPLLAFFRAIAAGQANTFRFRDWTDYTCAVGEGFLVAIPGSANKQMVKRYTYGGFTYDRVISKPVSGAITYDGAGLDYATGIATSGSTWSGQFDCWCRLNNDAARCQVVSRSGGMLIVEWNDIEIVEVVNENR